MKKSIILLIVSILGVSKISAIGINQAAVTCFENAGGTNSGIIGCFNNCSPEVQNVMASYPNISIWPLIRAISNDQDCFSYAKTSFAAIAPGCPNLLA